MNGFRILYSLPDGTRDTTFFGLPIASFPLDGISSVDLVCFFFHNAYPTATILDIKPDCM